MSNKLVLALYSSAILLLELTSSGLLNSDLAEAAEQLSGKGLQPLW
jgi:hypothetical protein